MHRLGPSGGSAVAPTASLRTLRPTGGPVAAASRAPGGSCLQKAAPIAGAYGYAFGSSRRRSRQVVAAATQLAPPREASHPQPPPIKQPAATTQTTATAATATAAAAAAAVPWVLPAAAHARRVYIDLPDDFDSAGALLQSPWVVLGIALAALWLVPRVLRLAVRWLLLPAAVAVLAYAAIQEPESSAAALQMVLMFTKDHPVLISVGIVVASALLLGPDILVAAAIAGTAALLASQAGLLHLDLHLPRLSLPGAGLISAAVRAPGDWAGKLEERFGGRSSAAPQLQTPAAGGGRLLGVVGSRWRGGERQSEQTQSQQQQQQQQQVEVEAHPVTIDVEPEEEAVPSSSIEPKAAAERSSITAAEVSSEDSSSASSSDSSGKGGASGAAARAKQLAKAALLRAREGARRLRTDGGAAIAEGAEALGRNAAPALRQGAEALRQNALPALRESGTALADGAEALGRNAAPALRRGAEWVGREAAPALREAAGDAAEAAARGAKAAAHTGGRALEALGRRLAEMAPEG